MTKEEHIFLNAIKISSDVRALLKKKTNKTISVLSVSLFLSTFILSIAPCFHNHIKGIYHQDQNQCVRGSKGLIYCWVSSVSASFMTGVEGHGHRDTFLTRSLYDYWYSRHFSCLLTLFDLSELQGHMLMLLLT